MLGTRGAEDQSEYTQHLKNRYCINNLEKTALIEFIKNVSFPPFNLSLSLFSQKVFCAIRYPILSAVQQCVMHVQPQKKKGKQQQLAISSQRGDSFITAFSCQHPRWVTPAKTGTVIFNLSERLADSASPQTLLVSCSHSWNIKAKSEPGAYVIVGHVLKVPPPRSCSTGHKLPWGLRILVRTRNPLHVSLHLRYVALQRDSTCPYLPVGLSCNHGWECAWMRPCNEPHLWLSSSRPGTEPSFTLLTINHGVTRGTVVLRHRREG